MAVYFGSNTIAGSGGGGGGAGVLVNQLAEFYVQADSTPGYDGDTGIYEHPSGAVFLETGKVLYDSDADPYPDGRVQDGVGATTQWYATNSLISTNSVTQQFTQAVWDGTYFYTLHNGNTYQMDPTDSPNTYNSASKGAAGSGFNLHWSVDWADADNLKAWRFSRWGTDNHVAPIFGFNRDIPTTNKGVFDVSGSQMTLAQIQPFINQEWGYDTDVSPFHYGYYEFTPYLDGTVAKWTQTSASVQLDGRAYYNTAYYDSTLYVPVKNCRGAALYGAPNTNGTSSRFWNSNTAIADNVFHVDYSDDGIIGGETESLVGTTVSGWKQLSVAFDDNEAAIAFQNAITGTNQTETDIDIFFEGVTTPKNVTLHREPVMGTYMLPSGSSVTRTDSTLTLGTTTEGWGYPDLGGDYVGTGTNLAGITGEVTFRRALPNDGYLKTWQMRVFNIAGTSESTATVTEGDRQYFAMPTSEQIHPNASYHWDGAGHTDYWPLVVRTTFSRNGNRLYVCTANVVYGYDMTTGGTEDNPRRIVSADFYGPSGDPGLQAFDERSFQGVSGWTITQSSVSETGYGITGRGQFVPAGGDSAAANSPAAYNIENKQAVGVPNKLLSSRAIAVTSIVSDWTGGEEQGYLRFQQFDIGTTNGSVELRGEAVDQADFTTANQSSPTSYRRINDVGFFGTDNDNTPGDDRYYPTVIPIGHDRGGLPYGQYKVFLRIA